MIRDPAPQVGTLEHFYDDSPHVYNCLYARMKAWIPAGLHALAVYLSTHLSIVIYRSTYLIYPICLTYPI